jgi:hypothetical protein
MEKVALCFLINNREAGSHTLPKAARFPHWTRVLQDQRFNVYALYTASPNNQPSPNIDPLFRQRAVTVQADRYIETAYGKASLAGAMAVLLEFAFHHDATNSTFVFLSESCMPLWSPQVIYETLTTRVKGSWFSKWEPTNPCRAGQQCVVCRQDAATILDRYQPVLESMRDTWAADERLFITILQESPHLLHKAEGPVLADWERPNKSSPHEFGPAVSSNDMILLLATDALFCRKVCSNSSLASFHKLFLGRSMSWWDMASRDKGSTHHLSNVLRLLASVHAL